MSSTKTQVLAKFQAVYPQCEPALQSQLFDDVNREIASVIQCRNSIIPVNSVANQQEYAWDPNGYVTQIHEAYWVRSATPGDSKQLEQMNIDKLAEEMTNWRAGTTPSEPRAYYISSAVANANSTGGQGIIGLWPPPSATTVAGYPIVNAYVSSAQALAGSDTVPVQLKNDYVYLYRMYQLFAEQRVPGEVRPWEMLADKEFAKNVAFVKQNQALAGTGTAEDATDPGANYIQGQETKRSVISRFLQTYKQCGLNLANVLFDNANREIVTRCQLRNGTLDVDVVANQRDYNYNPNGSVVMIHAAYWMPSAEETSWQVLYETSTDELNQLERSWLTGSTQGVPIRYYISSAPAGTNLTGGQGVLGLWPKPDQTSIGTPPDEYPRIRLEVCTSALMAEDDPLPVQILNSDVYLFHMLMRYSELKKPEDMPRWMETGAIPPRTMFEREMQKTVVLVKDIQDQTTTFFQPDWFGWGSAAR